MCRQVNEGWRHADEDVAFVELLVAGAELIIASPESGAASGK